MKISYDLALRQKAAEFHRTLYTVAIEQMTPGGMSIRCQGISDAQLEQDLLNAINAFNARRREAKPTT